MNQLLSFLTVVSDSNLIIIAEYVNGLFFSYESEKFR